MRNLTWIEPTPNAWGNSANRCDVLISCGPLDIVPLWMQALAPNGLRRVIAFSSMSALAKINSTDVAERLLAQRLQEMEAAVSTAAEQLRLSALLLRPTMIYGCGRDANISRLRKLARRLRLVVLPRTANGLRQPVHAEDLAAAVIAALERPAVGVLALGGAEALSYREMVARVIATIPGPVWLQSIPDQWFAALMRLGFGLDQGQIERMGIDQCADLKPARKALGFVPREFRPRAQDFEPAHCLQQQSGATLQVR
jgi:nucleoside-diphosphate-sugar epimerase